MSVAFQKESSGPRFRLNRLGNLVKDLRVPVEVARDKSKRSRVVQYRTNELGQKMYSVAPMQYETGGQFVWLPRRQAALLGALPGSKRA